ncbi:MAG: cation:proton antiporter [Phycisphaerae bacterium]
MESLLPFLAGIVVLGIAAQWIAWRVGLPSILLLLSCGILAGSVTGWLDPDAVFGALLTPAVSLSVALILYEGGLTLRLVELRRVGSVIRNLVTVGALATWVIGALAARTLLDLDLSLSILLGALLIVTGPTVITPLLRQIRPIGPVGPILKWEGIVIDPIGALVAVLVFEVILSGEVKHAAGHVTGALLKTILIGGGLGAFGAGVFILASQRRWLADHLENAVSLMLVFAVYTVAHHVQHESGLLAVIVMGMVLANQRWVDVEHLLEFKENLRVLLISTLFIVLGARMELGDLARLAPRGALFVLALVLVGRPISVWLSTVGSTLAMRERLFLAWMAPRGIVAAAIASVFAMRLEAMGYEGAGAVASITIFTIIATVAIYGLTASAVARKLGIAESNPQGVLFVGADPWSRAVASLLRREGFRVLLIDSNREHTYEARMAELPTYTGSILAEHTLDELDLGGMGRLLAVTPNDWVNVLAVRRFQRIFGRANCYQLSPQQAGSKMKGHRHLHGRLLFGGEETYPVLQRRIAEGYIVKATGLSEEFDYAAFLARHGESCVPLFVIDDRKRLSVITTEGDEEPKPGETVISLIREEG